MPVYPQVLQVPKNEDVDFITSLKKNPEHYQHLSITCHLFLCFMLHEFGSWRDMLTLASKLVLYFVTGWSVCKMGLHVAQVSESYGCEMRRKSAAVSDHGTGPFDFRAVWGRSLVVAGTPVVRIGLKIVSLNNYW